MMRTLLQIVVVAFSLFPLVSGAWSREPIARVPFRRRNHFRPRGNEFVDVDALRTHVNNTLTKIGHGFVNFERNTGSKHPNDDEHLSGLVKRGELTTRRIAPRQIKGPVSIPLSSVNAKEVWGGTINVGTPPEPFVVEFDTATSDLILVGSGCTSVNCQTHRRYIPEDSDTAVDQGKTFNGTLVGNPASFFTGEVVTDNVELAGFTVTNQFIGVASTLPSDLAFTEFSVDGIVGLASKSLSGINQEPLIFNFISQLVPNNVQPMNATFGFALVDSSSDISEFVVLGTDTTKFSPGFVTEIVQVDEFAFWQIKLNQVTVGSTVVVGQTEVIVDTGSAMVLVNMASATTIYAAIPGSKNQGGGMFSVPCNAIPNNVAFSFDGGLQTPIVISEQSFVFGALDPVDCLGGIVGSSELPSGFWVIGDVFLQNVYVEFNTFFETVSFAPLI